MTSNQMHDAARAQERRQRAKAYRKAVVAAGGSVRDLKDYHRAYRKTERGGELVRAAEKRCEAKRAALINDMKRKPCTDCGGCFHPVAMDFDHRPGEKKLFTIALGRKRFSLLKVLEEIAKCDVVCSNCHRVRTAKRTGRYETEASLIGAGTSTTATIDVAGTAAAGGN